MDNFVEQELDRSLDIFETKLYREGDELLLKLEELLENPEEEKMNCIGDNLDEYTHIIHCYLMNNHKHSDTHMAAVNYFMLLNLVAERIRQTCQILPLRDEEMKVKFPQLWQIRKWSNFIKHPKSFFLCHISNWELCNSPDFEKKKLKASFVIDQDFVIKYYGGRKFDEELKEKLFGKSDVLVKVPELPKLTEDFCQDLINFYHMLEKNEDIRIKLIAVSTIDDFAEEEE